ncbi:MFS transporter [Croceicoccus sp. BE223]|uniref:MFS transporter n=1 Tax=Croceicoccus sp. BE223 TaxID=2817716 RepID=UPI00285CC316|nr:MFS transporter [Croceicoccus sp. BE223]MDR7103666.1 putative MFS family arabinose efflux permease [Croceicoccus sp. BE223]
MLLLLALIYIFGSIDRAIPSVIVEPLKNEFALSDSQLGLLTGFAYSVPYALAALPTGWLIDRMDRRILLAISSTIWSLLTAVGAFAQSFTMLVLARVGVGASEAPASPGSLSLIGDLFPKERRGTAVSLYYAGTATGQMITFLVGGWLLLHFGWRSLFMIAAIPGLILAALLFFTCREPRRGQFDDEGVAAKEPVSYRKAMGTIVKSLPLRHAIMANMLMTGVQYAVMVWTVSLLVRIHGMSTERAAMAVGLAVGLVMMVGSLVVGFVADRYAKGDAARMATVPAIGTICAGLAGIAMCLMNSLVPALAFMALLAFFMGINTGPGYATLVSMTASNMRGSVLSVAKIASILVGNGCLAYFTGAASDLIGGEQSLRWALLLTVIFFFWAALHYALAARSWRNRKATEIL